MSIRATIQRIQRSRWAAPALALAAGLVYLLQALQYAAFLDSGLDEGNYLYKGLLFARGVYAPFQPFGPLTNKMPLSFLIPGVVQALIGPGLRTGRYFAILLALLLLLAVWIVARRFGGRWWAAAAVAALALNPSLARLYSQAVSEGLVAAMGAWVMVLVLGSDRPRWQLALGAALAGAVVLTRENMLPLALFGVLYVWWERGWRPALLCAAVGLAVVGGVHALFWPEIMTNWARQIPRNLTPFLNAFRIPIPGQQSWSPDVAQLSRYHAFWEGIRQHFLPLVGVLASLILWPRRADWKSPQHFRAAVSLLLLLAVLFAGHLWASILKTYCVYCFSPYLSFFSFIGLLITATCAPSWRWRDLPWPRQALAALLAWVCAAGVAFGAHQWLDDGLLTILIPRTRNMRILPGTTELWRSLSNKFGWSFEFQQWLLPLVAGAAVGALLIVLVFAGWRWWGRKRSAAAPGFLLLALLLAAAGVLGPTPLFGGVMEENACRADVIASYETVGAQLDEIIPAGARVYWRGGLSPAPLLYLADIRIYPPQLNDGYSVRIGGDPQELYRMGFWNAELSRQWLNEADYLLVEARLVSDAFKEQVAGQYEELQPLGRTDPCRAGSEIHIYRRLQ